MRSHMSTFASVRALAHAGLLGGAALVFAGSSASAQQVEVLTPEPLVVAPAVSIQTSNGVSNVQTVGWRNRVYGRPYSTLR